MSSVLTLLPARSVALLYRRLGQRGSVAQLVLYPAVENKPLGNPMNKGVRSAAGSSVKRFGLRSIGYIGTIPLWERSTGVLVQP
jgi:hypothetical protein